MVSIRQATADDAAAADFSGPAALYRDYLVGFVDGATRGTSALLVAVDGDGVIGRVALDLAKDGPDVAWMLAFEVRADHRDQGVGTALIAAAEQHVKACGARELRLSVGKTNPDALRLYERLGYRCIGAGTSAGMLTPAGRVVHPPEPVWVLKRAIG